MGVTSSRRAQKAAAQTVEALEKNAARGWYGGAVGMISRRRHQHRHRGSARRICATPASHPVGSHAAVDLAGEERRETRLKATGFFRTARRKRGRGRRAGSVRQPVRQPRFLVDNDLIVIHTLSNHARQTARKSGSTARASRGTDRKVGPNLILISARPDALDFRRARTGQDGGAPGSAGLACA
jgi:hypothetical protein